MLKKLIIISICTTCVIALCLIFKNEIFSIFREGKSINYNKDISYINVLGNFEMDGSRKKAMFDNKEDINKIIDYINSLEIIKTDRPNKSYLDDKGLISISIFGDSEELDGIVFTNRYMIIYNKGYDWEYTDYYIKDSGYDFITKETKIYKYFRDLVNQQ